jgi:thimet oligopeptidase
MNRYMMFALWVAVGLFGERVEALPQIDAPEKVQLIFPKNVEEINRDVAEAKQGFDHRLEMVLREPRETWNFETVVRGFDRAVGNFHYMQSVLSAIAHTSPQIELREAAQRGMIDLDAYRTEKMGSIPKLYTMLHEISLTQSGKLTEEENYQLSEILLMLEAEGLGLADEEREEYKRLSQEVYKLTEEFQRNISEENKFMLVSASELDGLEPEFIGGLEVTEGGKYVLRCSYPIYYPVIERCKVESTRKGMFQLMQSRGYPKNLEVLHQVIAKRDRMAKLLGYRSFAHFDVAAEMIGSPDRAMAFIYDLMEKARNVEAAEFDRIKSNLPHGVQLTEEGKLAPWDQIYAYHHIKKEHYSIDSVKISEYFPLDKTIAGLIQVYQSFFDLTIREVPIRGLWTSDLKGLEVREKSGELLGYVLLDLFPREGKYGHACDMPIIPAYEATKSRKFPALSLLICNFTQPTMNRPSLLTHMEVETFFHEFGHALHDLSGRSRLTLTCGTNVKRDFVELPSQILQEWMWDAEILRKVSSHYVTGEPMPEQMIKALVGSRNADSGNFIQQQGFYSLVSLHYFLDGETKDSQKILEALYQASRPNYSYDPSYHFQTSFGHLMGYGAKYYSYLWTKVMAADLFNEIKQEGLLNPLVGRRYREQVIGRGGAAHPDVLLRTFLGREPMPEPFLKSVGMEEVVPTEQILPEEKA